MRSTKRSRLELCAKVSGGSAPAFPGRDAKKKRTSEYRSNDLIDHTEAICEQIKRLTGRINAQQSADDWYASRVESLTASLEATKSITRANAGFPE